ncbi:hypothetical protein CALCODRAFT_90511 [Calocera cornea HHB12733]|uniref:Uncharacterized protein n=1 Tax=Calocera cornea HHB12733 TaxID=1353952 RepID=A0A165DAH8_9BASI|nr:hypothetical protein CALCODRAFT_90511 [Calocera cornea HHB12733]
MTRGRAALGRQWPCHPRATRNISPELRQITGAYSPASSHRTPLTPPSIAKLGTIPTPFITPAHKGPDRGPASTRQLPSPRQHRPITDPEILIMPAWRRPVHSSRRLYAKPPISKSMESLHHTPPVTGSKEARCKIALQCHTSGLQQPLLQCQNALASDVHALLYLL